MAMAVETRSVRSSSRERRVTRSSAAAAATSVAGLARVRTAALDGDDAKCAGEKVHALLVAEGRGREGTRAARLSLRAGMNARVLCKWTCGMWGVLLLGKSPAVRACAAAVSCQNLPTRSRALPHTCTQVLEVGVFVWQANTCELHLVRRVTSRLNHRGASRG